MEGQGEKGERKDVRESGREGRRESGRKKYPRLNGRKATHRFL